MFRLNWFAVVCITFLISILALSFIAPDLFLKSPEFKPEEAVIEGKVVEFPEKEEEKTTLVIKTESLDERIYISTYVEKEFNRGEFVKAEGEIKRPENFTEEFNWPAYLKKEGIGYVMYDTEVEKTGRTDKNVFYYANAARDKLSRNLNAALLPPNSTLYSAMILGNKTGITEEQRDNLGRAGLSHIVAISGMHIAIITIILFYVLAHTGLLRRDYASYIALSLMAFYIILVGAPASAVRAGMMAGVVIFAERLGRPRSTWRALIYAATIMVVLNPLIVRHDIGFQLSFLAVSGILLFADKIKFWLGKLKIPEGFFKIRSVLSMTFSAQVFTAPLVFYNFGVVSFTAPITNLLVVPALPVVIPAGFLATTGSKILATPAWFFGEYIWGIVSLFS